MGSGIAQVCAEAGLPGPRARGRRRLPEEGPRQHRSFPGQGRREGQGHAGAQGGGPRPAEGDDGPRASMGECDLVIEVVTESLDVKRQVFQALDAACRPEAIFASNTSSLSITEMAATTKRPSRFVGLHFFNPVPLMKLVEVVRSPLTDPAVYEEVAAFAASLGKTPVRASDKTGFVVNRLLVPVPARRDPRPGGRRRLHRGHRRRHAPGLRASHGSAHPARLRGAGHHVLRSRTSCSTSSARSASPRRRSSSAWCRPASTDGRRAVGFYDYAQEPPRPVAGLV